MVRRNEHPRLYLTHCSEVPVVVVFTKHDQFLLNVAMHVDDYPDLYPNSDVSEVAEQQFQERYLHPLGKNTIFVRLESGFGVKSQECMLTFFGRNAHAK